VHELRPRGLLRQLARRHATAHFAGTTHPVVKSFEPGEDWLWCYADETVLEL
jgi:hypothetical protein